MVFYTNQRNVTYPNLVINNNMFLTSIFFESCYVTCIVLPVVNERYELRNPVFHLHVVNHKFAVQSLKYWLIRQLNMDKCSNIIADKALRFLLYSFKGLLYPEMLEFYFINIKIFL